MPTFEVHTVELGTRIRKFIVVADDSDLAVERVFDDEIKPVEDTFKQREMDRCTVREFRG